MEQHWLSRLVTLLYGRLVSTFQARCYTSPNPSPSNPEKDARCAMHVAHAVHAPTSNKKTSPSLFPKTSPLHTQHALIDAGPSDVLNLSPRTYPFPQNDVLDARQPGGKTAHFTGRERHSTALPRRPWPPTPEQAKQFCSWLKKHHGGESIPAQRIIDCVYPQFCRSMGWRPRPWNSIAKELKVLLRCRRGGDQEEWYDEDGRRHKRRVYHIPKPGVPLPLHSRKRTRRKATHLGPKGQRAQAGA